MERVVSALNRAANSNAVVNSFLGVVFCGLAARSWVQDPTVRALEAENEVLKKNNKQIKNTIWEWKQTLYAEASANPQKALVPLSALQAIYGDVVTPVSSSGNFTIHIYYVSVWVPCCELCIKSCTVCYIEH